MPSLHQNAGHREILHGLDAASDAGPKVSQQAATLGRGGGELP
jgi:hypothetical protein